MKIYMFATVHASKFSKKENAYLGVKSIEWHSEPLTMAGMKVQAFDANILMPVEIYLLIRDAKTGHMSEDGYIDASKVVAALEEMGIFPYEISGDPHENQA